MYHRNGTDRSFVFLWASSSSSEGFDSAPKSSPLPASAQVLVVGGGAAGLTAAYFAAQAGAKVTVLERTREAGKKICMHTFKHT
ncbi:hypothetical protein OEZ85_013790 [Tetradesmus obliquus]|uniref:FAD dependent oxidoreductase domain-containing protein n=1 Tax=Tetradesmus obliquus TaxID=3088 RepID=A0ABY8U5W8_TETOB|nr:hypothetical protein OEZ85_013790 [Tetradesmus obliquus]